jgi:phospholipid/cholesterol/gamma-HCH transport system substrate-binding protein
VSWREQFTGRRAAAIGALAVVLIVVIALIIKAQSSYQVHALFSDASQLVKGDLIEVGGRPVGTVQKISLRSDNQADVLMKITAGDVKPLHQGTLLTVRPVGQSGIANRYIQVDPGPDSAPKIADGGTLPATATIPQVDLDALLDSLDPTVRKALQDLFREGARVFHGRTKDVNSLLAYLNPALGQTRAVTDELTRDNAAVGRLVRTGAALSAALVSRRPDLQQGIANAAATMRAIGSENAALGDTLSRAPGVLRQGRGTLASLTAALAQVNPALREAQPSAAPLAKLLRQLPPTTRAATPVLRDVADILPPLDKGLRSIPALAQVAVPALQSTTKAVGDALPIFAGLRPYGPDLVNGLLKGVAGDTTFGYDANGHFVRVTPLVSATGASGLLSLPGVSPSSLSGVRTGITARCPGGAVEPAPDSSNPWIPDPALCNPADDHK